MSDSFGPGRRLSSAQWRALRWLPPNGDWRVVAEPGIARALVAFQMCAGLGCVEQDVGAFGSKGGLKARWRLNERGVSTFYPEQMESRT